MHPLYHENFPNVPGIYRITCIPTGKFYIGSAINLRHRRRAHFGALQRNEHRNPKLQATWNKYGSDAFRFEIIELILFSELLIVREQYWLDKLQPFGDHGFNIDRVAGSRLGSKHSPETLEKLRIASLGNTYSLGKSLSPECKAKLRAINIGNTRSLGRIESPETRARKSASKLGKKLSPVARERQKIAKAGKMKTLIVTSPDGTEYHVRGVKAFSKEHHLDFHALMKIAKGKQRSHKGWTARFPETSTG